MSYESFNLPVFAVAFSSRSDRPLLSISSGTSINLLVFGFIFFELFCVLFPNFTVVKFIFCLPSLYYTLPSCF